MIERSVPTKLIERLKDSKFWKNIVSDSELQPEIRKDKITVYYRAAAFLHELRLTSEAVVAGISRAYIPLDGLEKGPESRKVELKVTESGTVSFRRSLSAMNLGEASSETRNAFKKRIAENQGKDAEGAIVQAICDQKRNVIVDQEISFSNNQAVEGKAKVDKIDLCCYENTVKKFVFVEVKRLEDPRLQVKRDTEAEILSQLRNYGQRIRECSKRLPEVLQYVVDTKRALGIIERYRDFPKAGCRAVCLKPALVIGHCDSATVARIRADRQPNFPKLDDISKVASALVLCKSDCVVQMTNSRSTIVFDAG